MSENLEAKQPSLGSISSSSCSSTSSTSYSISPNPNQSDLNLVMIDLKQICSTLSLLARQIDQVVDKIDSKFGLMINDQSKISPNQSINSLKNLKSFTKIINSNLNNYCNKCQASSTRSYSERKSCTQNSIYSNSSNTNTKTKCPRSKSQPAFKETSFSNTNNLTKLSCLEANRLTSSPICNFSLNSSTNETVLTQTALLNDSSNGDSSFYEDQLDNELESFSNSNNSNSDSVEKKKNFDCNIEPKIKNGIQKNLKLKHNNSNHHVSFNINNAIYTSKQETPIPISILKPTPTPTQSQIQAPILSNNLNQSPNHSSGSSSPLQSLIKNSKSNKTVRIDNKTTIL